MGSETPPSFSCGEFQAEPIPFGGMGKPVNQNGFSDHFPVQVTVEEAD